MDEGIAWPLPEVQRARVLALGELIRRHGTARFVDAQLVAADARDFPEPWEPTLFAVHRLLYRLFWHAHLEPDIVVEDIRAPTENRQMLRSSEIDLVEVKDGRVTFQVSAIGNDDVAGVVCHAIGAAFLELGPPDPFRAVPVAPTTTDASIAACYLGLGVLVSNASMYRRYESRIRGREVVSEQRVETTGGLSIGDATLLLAVQLVVRDDVPRATKTLHAPQTEWLERWTALLDPHEDELRTMLGLDEMKGLLPERAGTPRVPDAVAEPVLMTKANLGRISFRIPRRRNRMFAGLGLGLVAAILCRVIFGEAALWLLLLPIGAIGGRLVTRAGFECVACRTTLAAELPVCSTCGVTLTETLATREAQAARRAEFAAEREAADAELAAEAELAEHPDV